MSFFSALLSQPIGNQFYVSSAGSGSSLTASEFEALYPSIPVGSSIYFNRGDTFDLSLDVTKPLVFDAYGSGDAPIIRTSVDISGQTWTEESTGLWYTTMSQTPYGVVLEGVRGTQAQTSFINIQARPSTTQITGPSATLDALNTTESLVGADIVAKEFSFRPTFRRQITNYGVGTGVLTFNAQFQNNNAPASGYGFKLLNLKSFVANDRDWAYYSSTNRLYVKSATSPALRTVRAIVNDYGFNLSDGVDNIQIKNLQIIHTRLAGIYSSSNDNLVISGCTVRQSQLNGIHLIGNSSNVFVDNNTIYTCNGNGIHIGGITQSIISNNHIYDIGLQTGISIPYYPDVFRSVGCGIHSRWDITTTPSVMTDVVIEHNNVHDVGYIGIAFVGNPIVRENRVDNFCLKWNDGGGIYCIDRPYGTGHFTSNALVYKNTVTNGIGNLDGIIAESTLHAEGIYVDNGCSYITIDNNHVKGMSDYGIMANFDTSFTTVTDNKVSNCVTAAVSFREDTSFDYGPYNPDWEITFVNNVGNVCTGNTLVANNTSQVCIEARSFNSSSSYNPFSSGGNCDSNMYISPYRANIARHFAGTETLYTLAGWQTKISDDALSTALVNYLLFVNAMSAAVDILHNMNPTNASVNDTPGSNYMKVDKTQAGTESIPAYSSIIYTAKYIVEDTFTGSSVGIASHSPEIGGSYTEQAGTLTINGSGRLVASVAGACTQDAGNKNVTVTTVGRVTTTNNVIAIMLRYTDENNYIMVQLSINGASSQVRLINRVGGSNTTLSTANPGVLAANTDYILKVKVVNSEMWVHMNNVLFINSSSGAWTTNNATGTVHGLRVNTVSQYDEFAIVGGFTS